MAELGAVARFVESMWLVASDDISEEKLDELPHEAVYKLACLNTLQMVAVMPARLRKILTDEAAEIKEQTG